MNFAYWAARSGCRSGIISAVGRDDLGEELCRAIAPLGVDLTALQTNGYPTGTVRVTLSSAGEPSYEICEGAAWDNITDSTIAVNEMKAADAVCWGSLVQRTPTCRNVVLNLVDAAPKNALRIFDINLRQHFYTADTVDASLRRADILKLNETELPEICSLLKIQGIDGLLSRYNLRYVVYTAGASHSEVFGDGIHSYLPTPKVEVASTVGAGDSFTATFAAEILNGKEVSQAHRRAVEVSAEVCRHDGAIF